MELYRFQHPYNKDYIIIYALADNEQEILDCAASLESGDWEIEHLATLNEDLIDLRRTALKYSQNPNTVKTTV